MTAQMPFDPDEFPPELDAAERSELSETAAHLLAARPRPSPAFRGELRRQVLDRAGILRPRPPRLRRRVATFLTAGALLLLLAASGLTGSGPLAPPADPTSHLAQVR